MHASGHTHVHVHTKAGDNTHMCDVMHYVGSLSARTESDLTFNFTAPELWVESRVSSRHTRTVKKSLKDDFIVT